MLFLRYAVALLLGVCASSSFATTLVALWTPEKLVIGADSLVVTTEGPAKASACKISHEGSTLFAMSGLVEDSSAGLNVSALARDTARQGGSMPAKIERFTGSIKPKLGKAIGGLKL